MAGILASLLPAIPGLLSGLFNKKKAPETAPYMPVDLGAEQQKAIAANTGAEGDIEKLLSQANAYTQGQASSMMEKAVPGYAAYSKKLLQTGTDALAHPYDLPADVQANLARISAEKGISTGTGSGSEFGKFSATRDLGLNMLDYGNSNFAKAVQALTTVTGTAPRISPMSPMSFYVTPQALAQNQQYTNTVQQQIQQGANNASAAAGNFNNQNLWDSISRAAGPLISAYTGGAGAPAAATVGGGSSGPM